MKIKYRKHYPNWLTAMLMVLLIMTGGLTVAARFPEDALALKMLVGGILGGVIGLTGVHLTKHGVPLLWAKRVDLVYVRDTGAVADFSIGVSAVAAAVALSQLGAQAWMVVQYSDVTGWWCVVKSRSNADDRGKFWEGAQRRIRDGFKTTYGYEPIIAWV